MSTATRRSPDATTPPDRICGLRSMSLNGELPEVVPAVELHERQHVVVAEITPCCSPDAPSPSGPRHFGPVDPFQFFVSGGYELVLRRSR